MNRVRNRFTECSLAQALLTLHQDTDAVMDAILGMNNYVNDENYGVTGAYVYTAKGTSIMAIVYG